MPQTDAPQNLQQSHQGRDAADLHFKIKHYHIIFIPKYHKLYRHRILKRKKSSTNKKTEVKHGFWWWSCIFFKSLKLWLKFQSIETNKCQNPLRTNRDCFFFFISYLPQFYQVNKSMYNWLQLKVDVRALKSDFESVRLFETSSGYVNGNTYGLPFVQTLSNTVQRCSDHCRLWEAQDLLHGTLHPWPKLLHLPFWKRHASIWSTRWKDIVLLIVTETNQSYPLAKQSVYKYNATWNKTQVHSRAQGPGRV